MMPGLGVAFNVLTGQVREAPRWMQMVSLEWFFRLLMEPRRLWRRYAKHNPRFMGLFLLQLAKTRFLNREEKARG